jgi:hypothetical protein
LGWKAIPFALEDLDSNLVSILEEVEDAILTDEARYGGTYASRMKHCPRIAERRSPVLFH